MITAELLVDQQCKLGEGPIWISKQGKLYWVDILLHNVHSCDHQGRDVQTYKMPNYVSNIYETNSDQHLVVALADGLYVWNVAENTTTALALFEEENTTLRTNDGFCDPQGNLWIGTMGLTEEEGQGDLWMLDRDNVWHNMLAHTHISNGIRSNLSGDEIFYIDTPTHQVRKFKFDDISHSWELIDTVFEIDSKVGHPDGMAIDVNGHLWIALWDGFAVICVNPTSGEIIEKISVPAPHVSACTFGGPDLSTLFITTAKKDMTSAELEQYPHAGGIFKVELDVTGRPNHVYGLK